MNKMMARAAALLAMVGWTWIAPQPALAQLLPPLGKLIVTMTAPANGASVSGTVPVTASVTVVGALTVAGVQFNLDGADLGAEDKSAPYSISWNSATAGNGTHTIRAVARDVLGVQWTSNPVTVTVTNDVTAPTVTINQAAGQADPTNASPLNFTVVFSEPVSGFTGADVTLSGSAGGTRTATVSGGPRTYNVAVSGMTTGAVIAGIAAGVAQDAAGNANSASTSTDNSVTFDATAPTVSITSPASGATVAGPITVTANAWDSGSVAGVQFLLDGAALGGEDTTAPYSAPWDTGTASNGAHTLTAVARDAVGNRATSAPVTVTVSNGPPPDTIAPQVSITAPASGDTVSGTISLSADASDNVGVAGVQFQLDGANAGAEVTAAPYSAPWDTTTASRGSHTLTAIARDAAGNRTTSAPVTVTVANPSPIAIENQQPGSGNWRMFARSGVQPADDVGKQIKGYASATSVNKGESITFHVTVTPAQQYTIDVYRMGWYEGLGGRLLQQVGPLQGVEQPACPVDSATGLIECNWAASHTLTVPTDWTSGVFLAHLTNAQGYQNWIPFVVRDDARRTDLVFQQADTTYQAYNNYPDDGATGKSIYAFNSRGPNTVTGTTRAVKVSWNRPYAGRGAGQYFTWEFYFIRWLERSGYDVKYVTALDTHQNSARLLSSKALLSVGHDEYWSKQMYDGVEQARDAGMHLGFFGANAVYWQVRLEPSTLNGAADRVMVGYKDRTIDPVQGPTTTVLWRDPFLNRPEQRLMGVQFSGQIPFEAPNVPYVVKNSSSWVYEGTGLADGDSIPGIVGYEMDSSMTSAPLPASVPGTYQILSESPFVDAGAGPTLANSAIYQAPSGAWVFGAGTSSWSWGMELDGVADPRIQRITANLLNRFAGAPPQP